MKKTIAFIISLALVFAFLPHFEIKSKAWTNHIGTEYGSVQDLCNLRDAINSDPSLENIDIFFNQNDIIDLTGINWEPIKHYTGHIYGNGATIRGLTIDPVEALTAKPPLWTSFASYNNIGLISIAEGAEIENLTVSVNRIQGHHLVGAFCGQAMSTYIHDCIVRADNQAWDLEKGVIIGMAGVGGFAGGFAGGLGGPYSDYDQSGVFGASPQGSIANCRTLYPLQVYATGYDYRDTLTPYGVNITGSASAYQNAPDYICTNVLSGVSYYSLLDGHVSINSYGTWDNEEGFYSGGFVGITWETPCNFYGCDNSAFVCAYNTGGGGIIGYSMTGAVIRNCVNNGFINGNDTEYSAIIPSTDMLINNECLNKIRSFGKSVFSGSDVYHTNCNQYFGGITGISGAGTIIEDCSNRGPVEGDNYIGGITGTMFPAVKIGTECLYSRITNSFNIGPVGTNYDHTVAGIVGVINPFLASTVQTYGSGCPYCDNGNSAASYSGRCDNLIENCYNVGGLYSSVQRPVFPLDNSVVPDFKYGGIACINYGIIRNCYSNNDDSVYTVSICFDNSGVIDHCFGRSVNCVGAVGTGGTVTGYGRFSNNFSGMVNDVFELYAAGPLSGSTSLLDELNFWVESNVFYSVYRGLSQYAAFSYFGWVGDPGVNYDVFGIRKTIYKLEYNPAGGASGPGIQYGNGQIILSTGVPFYSGHTFSYWQDPADPQTQHYRGRQFNLTQDTTLFAVWDQGEYDFKIVFDDNGGSGGPGTVYGNGYTMIPARVPVKSSYDFVGWDTSPSATVAVYSPGDWLYLTASMTLYAVWELETVCTLTYNLNGGNGTLAPVTQPRGTVITLDSGSNLTRSGYNFFGWALSPNASTPDYSGSASYTLNASTTLYALWLPEGTAPAVCDIYYYSNDGTNNVTWLSSHVGQTVTIDDGSSLSYSSHTFLGWSTSSSAVSPDPAYTPGGQFTLTGNLVLYAVWAQDVTLTYNPNGGSNAPQSQTGYGQITLSNVRPFKSGCNFLGWTTTPHAVNPLLYSPGSTFNLTQNTTLYACWENATAVTTESATPSFEAGTRGSQLTWTVLTPADTVWVRLKCSYKDTAGNPVVYENSYKYSTYLNVDGMTNVSDTENVRLWMITLPVSYFGNADSVVQNWTVTSKAKGSSVWETVPVDTDSANQDGSIDITVAKTQAILDSILGAGAQPYEPNTLLSIDADRESASPGEYVYFTVVTSPDVSKVRISYVNADTGKKKTSTYQTSSTALMSYSLSEDSANAIWVIRYKVSAPAQGNAFTAECRGEEWASAKTVSISVE